MLLLVGLLVIAAGALAILIYSINWNEHKAKISEQFSAATGKKVVFAGPVELKFLPSPYLTAQDIKIYSEKAEIPQPLAEVKSLVARLDLVPLLKGELYNRKYVNSSILYDKVNGVFTTDEQIDIWQISSRISN